MEEHLCVRCSKYMKTCCQTSEIYVTPGDVQRIAEDTGRDDFYEARKPSDPVYCEQDDDPVWRDYVFSPDGSRRVLRREASGDCTFLGKDGCQLALEVRPLVCRIYPFLYTERGLEPDALGEGCPRELIPLGKTLLEELSMDRVEAERWRKQLYSEVRQEPNPRARAAE